MYGIDTKRLRNLATALSALDPSNLHYKVLKYKLVQNYFVSSKSSKHFCSKKKSLEELFEPVLFEIIISKKFKFDIFA